VTCRKGAPSEIADDVVWKSSSVDMAIENWKACDGMWIKNRIKDQEREEGWDRYM
jgi:hypothetical protein